jgi:hypothetical protein
VETYITSSNRLLVLLGATLGLKLETGARTSTEALNSTKCQQTPQIVSTHKDTVLQGIRNMTASSLFGHGSRMNRNTSFWRTLVNLASHGNLTKPSECSRLVLFQYLLCKEESIKPDQFPLQTVSSTIFVQVLSLLVFLKTFIPACQLVLPAPLTKRA